MARDQDGGRAFQRVAQQRRGREPLAAGAQHIGGADIAGADCADVAEARRAGEDQAEGDRAEQIADDEAAARMQTSRWTSSAFASLVRL